MREIIYFPSLNRKLHGVFSGANEKENTCVKKIPYGRDKAS